jgi:hypothetical protein
MMSKVVMYTMLGGVVVSSFVWNFVRSFEFRLFVQVTMVYVHYDQADEKKRMHKGVEREHERLRLKRQQSAEQSK